MEFRIPFLNRVPIDITQVNIAYNTTMHSFGGLKAKGKFVYKLPFSNSESVPMRVLSINIDSPFLLKKISHNLPIDVEVGGKVVFELKCEYKEKFAYSGPLGIKLMALPISSKLFKKN